MFVQASFTPGHILSQAKMLRSHARPFRGTFYRPFDLGSSELLQKLDQSLLIART